MNVACGSEVMSSTQALQWLKNFTGNMDDENIAELWDWIECSVKNERVNSWLRLTDKNENQSYDRMCKHMNGNNGTDCSQQLKQEDFLKMVSEFLTSGPELR